MSGAGRVVFVGDLVGVREIAERLGLSASQEGNFARTRATDPSFPAPLVVLAMGPVYDYGDVLAWHRARTRERRAS